MKAFSVLINGQAVATIGAGSQGLLTAIIHWMAGRPSEIGGEFSLMLGGLTSGASDQQEHLRWPSPSLTLGDEVTIRLVDADRVDPPSHREPSSPLSAEMLAQAGITGFLEEEHPAAGHLRAQERRAECDGS
jgi:hypothetical protein